MVPATEEGSDRLSRLRSSDEAVCEESVRYGRRLQGISRKQPHV